MIFFPELVNKLTLTLFSSLFSFLISYGYKEILWFILTHKILLANNFYFVYTNIFEVFSVYFQFALFIAYQFCFFYMVINSFSFLSPGLYNGEFFFLRKFLFLFFNLVFFSIFFLVFWIFPSLWQFFMGFQDCSLTNLLHFEVKMSDFFKVFIQIYYFLVFHCFLNIFGLLTVQFLLLTKKAKVNFRKFIYLFFLLIHGLLINLPDFFLVLVFFVFQSIYELSLYLLLLKNFLKR